MQTQTKQADYDVLRPLKASEWSKDRIWLYNRSLFLCTMMCCNRAVYMNEAYVCDSVEDGWAAWTASYEYEDIQMSKAYPRLSEMAWDEYSKKNCESIARGDGILKAIPYKK